MTTPTTNDLSRTLLTAPGSGGAIAVLRLHARDAGALERGCHCIGLPVPDIGAARLAELFGVDRGVATRWSADTLDLMPHAGRAVLSGLEAQLEARGVRTGETSPAPEASTLFDTALREAMVRCDSARGLDRLFAEPARLLSGADGLPPDRARSLRHLLEPPTIVAVGEPNIGKSSLLNALAGRTVALAYDEPGTTRDHVGVLLDADGLAIRYVDTAGTSRGTNGGHSAEIEALLGSADLVLLAADARREPPPGDGLRVALRADLAPASPAWADVVTSASTGAGVADLARRIRTELVPDDVLSDPRPWRWWGEGGA